MKAFQKFLVTNLLFLSIIMLVSIVSCNTCNPRGELITIATSNKPSSPVQPTISGGGIVNIGNTCYMNSVLQAIKAFYPDSFAGQRDELEEIGQKVMEQLDGEAGVDKATASAFFEAVSGCTALSFKPRPKAMEDAHELLIALLDKLDFPKAKRGYKRIHPNSGVIAISQANDFWNNLQIGFLGANSKTMQEYFDEEMGEEVLDRNTKWHPEDLQPTAGIKSYTILSDLHKLKNGILIVQIKRILHDQASGLISKATQPVKNPFHLVIKKSQIFVKEKLAEADRRYELVGFIEHKGTNMNVGHYVAYIKKGATWYLHNDQEPGTAVPWQNVEAGAESAYIYFYRPC